MNILDATFNPSYDDVNFLVLSISAKDGIKDVLDEFPGSNLQHVQNLGVAPDSYNVRAVISSSDGDAYKAKYDALRGKLASGKAAIFVHPWRGEIANVKCRSWSSIEDFTRAGRADFTIEFAVDNSDGLPAPTEIAEYQIGIQGDQTVILMTFDLSEGWKPPENEADVESMTDKVKKAIKNIKKILERVSDAGDELNQIAGQLSKMATEVVALVNAPAELAQSLNNVMASATNLIQSPRQAFSALSSTFKFGSGDEKTARTTPNRARRDRSLTTLNNFYNVQALSLAYSVATEIDFLTVDEIDEALRILEEQYNFILSQNSTNSNNSANTSGEIQPETLSQLDALRASVQAFFDRQRITARQIITVEVQPISSRLASYQQYGDSSLGSDIAALNKTVDLTFMSGKIEVYTR